MLLRPTGLLGAIVLIGGVTVIGGIIASAAAGDNSGPPASKQAAMDKYNHDRQVAQTQRHAPKNPNAPVTIETPAAAPQGIFPYRFGPFPGGVYDIKNIASIRTTSGDDLVVYAGALATDSTQGVVIVVGHAGNSVEVARDSQEAYLSPRHGGALTLTGLGANEVTFSYAAGGSGTFNLLSRRFS